MKLELVVIPVSACSMTFGKGIAEFGEGITKPVTPGTVKGLQMVKR